MSPENGSKEDGSEGVMVLILVFVLSLLCLEAFGFSLYIPVKFWIMSNLEADSWTANIIILLASMGILLYLGKSPPFMEK